MPVLTRPRPFTPATLLALAGFVCLAPSLLRAQPPAARTIPALRPPVIDGRLTDPAWTAAPVIEGFAQREPTEGAPVSELTQVRIVYDQTNLYIAADLRDSEPAGIRASELRRDNTLESDDTFSVLIDTFLDHRNASVFRVNPRGTRFDALIRNESRVMSTDWDEQWTAAAALTETGWSVEIAIPFK
ncbi:MAG: carbohydrate binding family 9 domain-containing protein, partial [Vicinamibacterales bacterium]